MELDDEKHNMWVCFLNLELQFGTEDDLQAAYLQALRYADRKRITLDLIRIYIRADMVKVRHNPEQCLL